MKQQLKDLKQELKLYQEFSQDLKTKWKDNRSEEFYKKYINGTFQLADSYIFNSNKLLSLIDEANNLNQV